MTAAYLPLEVIAGDDFYQQFISENKDCDTNVETPIDMSVVESISGFIYDLDGVLLDNFSTEIEVASTGTWSIALNGTQTAALAGSNTKKVTEKIGRYAVKWYFTGGAVETKAYGPFSSTKVAGA